MRDLRESYFELEGGLDHAIRQANFNPETDSNEAGLTLKPPFNLQILAVFQKIAVIVAFNRRVAVFITTLCLIDFNPCNLMKPRAKQPHSDDDEGHIVIGQFLPRAMLLQFADNFFL